MQHLAFLPILVILDLRKSFQRPGKLYYVTVYCAVIWVFNSLTPKSVPAGTKLLLFGRYVLNIYVGIV